MQSTTLPRHHRLGGRAPTRCFSPPAVATPAHASSGSAPAPSSPPSLLHKAQLLASVSRCWYSRQQLPAPSSPQELRQQMASAGRSCMAVLPLAAMGVVAGGGGAGMGDIFDALSKAIDIYLFLLTVRVLLSWFKPNWYNEPFRTLRSFTDPALNACRGIIPAVGGMDLSPMLLFFGLNFAAKQLKMMALGAA